MVTVAERPIHTVRIVHSFKDMDTVGPSFTHPPRQHHSPSAFFLREALGNFREVGAVAPSSAALARALSAPVELHRTPRTVLEVGAGTGAVTAALVDRLGAADRLDIVESNPRFAAELQAVYARTHLEGGPRIRVRCARIELLHSTFAYDLIVSGLPFANFEPNLVETIVDRYQDLLTPEGSLTYFSYLGTRRIRSLTASRSDALRHRAVEEALARYRQRFEATRRTVWANMPAAHVWHLRGIES